MSTSSGSAWCCCCSAAVELVCGVGAAGEDVVEGCGGGIGSERGGKDD